MKDKYITVTQLTRYIKFQIDNDKNLNQVFLRGEISNFKAHSRGHYYFTLKDENSRINAIMFSFNTKNIKFIPQDGMKVLVTGKISVFESSGNYQIYVEEMLEDGIGNLHIAFEQLKEKLNQEGLFAPEHKKSIPKIPSKIGVITAPTGAAIRDILSTINRRFAISEVILFPSLVQGEEAKYDIVKKLQLADQFGVDVIILGRGGGSIEDLWPFNEEIVARAVYDANTPIISAVGHEIDFTICDFVADLRAETPTGAAERAVPNLLDVINYIEQITIRANKSLTNNLDKYNIILKKIMSSYILKNPMSIYEIKEQKLDMAIDKINSIIKNIIEVYNNNINSIIEKLEILNPLNSLKRGYSIVRKNNKIAKITDLNKGDIIDIKMSSGLVKSKIEEVIKDA